MAATKTRRYPSTAFTSFAQTYRPLINQALNRLLTQQTNHQPYSQILLEAMRYSSLLAGKRIRPLLVLASCRICGGLEKSALNAAAAVEMVHAFSLVHDDLPAMDNDDLRRGQPTNHKVYGEAQAILAGDGLLIEAFSVLARHLEPPATAVACIRELAEATGLAGMVSGQSIEMNSLATNSTVEELRRINRLKTGKLLEASAVIGAVIGAANPTQQRHLRQYGTALGQLFQLTDDLLDLVSDQQTDGRQTIAGLLGVKQCRREIDYLFAQAVDHLRPFAGAETLVSLAQFVRDRQE